MNPTFNFTLTSGGSSAIVLNSVCITRGMTPSVAPPGSCDVPMQCVFPEPVCPYARTVALYPQTSPRTSGSTHCSYSAFSVGPGP
jgi:hypothetical protein